MTKHEIKAGDWVTRSPDYFWSYGDKPYKVKDIIHYIITLEEDSSLRWYASHFEPYKFQPGDLVIRKPEYQGHNGWTVGAKIFEVADCRINTSAYSEGPYIIMLNSGFNWDSNKFDLVTRACDRVKVPEYISLKEGTEWVDQLDRRTGKLTYVKDLDLYQDKNNNYYTSRGIYLNGFSPYERGNLIKELKTAREIVHDGLTYVLKEGQ